jgi:hypothetical protein
VTIKGCAPRMTRIHMEHLCTYTSVLRTKRQSSFITKPGPGLTKCGFEVLTRYLHALVSPAVIKQPCFTLGSKISTACTLDLQHNAPISQHHHLPPNLSTCQPLLSTSPLNLSSQPLNLSTPLTAKSKVHRISTSTNPPKSEYLLTSRFEL